MTKQPFSGQAPDFTLVDAHGAQVRLSTYRDSRSVVLVFNRGFT